MRYDNNIETMHQLSSQRGHEERTAIAERNRNRFLSSFGMTERLEGGRTERSVALEQQSNRFLTLFGMTEDKGENFTPRFGLTPYNGACGLNCPPTGRGTSGAGGFEEDPAEVGGYRLAARGSQLTATLLTIKYNNPSSKRVAGITKNAHLSVFETMGTGDNKLFPFFLISKSEKQWSGLASIFEMSYCRKGNRPPLSPEGGNFLPFGEVRRGQLSNSGNISETCLIQSVLKGQSGTFANANKMSAYET
ncbi:hypothetical protein [Draconibacterium mangrovi]|uniref:hypothetical protein n=1 Tax=Draconibacterium mangrovi TaxID=2697469 RepID=UPI0013D48D68|nr:hypothetical protein [Draconibacterium mangrovi]